MGGLDALAMSVAPAHGRSCPEEKMRRLAFQEFSEILNRIIDLPQFFWEQ
jgi:hypothetical protein